ncbi:RagB/SusD family nutrient uptake outer membrane protein [Chryseobacterium sp. NKUCC03_KSP]|nr:RagB/SusD family nutrient uptake outer membrane protein [Chryseobacterium sp. NKUCC03_KSP]
MKKFKTYIIAALGSMLIYSCNDALDITQAGEAYDEQAFNTSADLAKFLEGSVYSSADIMNQIKYTSLFTDELKIGPANAGQDQGTFRYLITPNDPFVEGIWGGQYLLINRVNQLIDKSSQITPLTPADIASYNNTLAEARVLRAFAYLNLMTYYSTDMKNDNALGVILSDKIYPFETKLPRVNNGAIWSFVESDLAFADTNLAPPGSHPASYFVSKNFVNALRARMYLYRGNYPLAKQYATAVLNTNGLVLTPATPIPAGTPSYANPTQGPPLVPIESASWAYRFYTQTTTPSPYRQMLFDNIVGENIFKLSRPSVGGTGGNIANLWTTNTTSITGSPWWVTGVNLVAAYQNTPNDLRRWAYTDPTSATATNTYVIDKYPGKNNTVLKNDIKVIRLSEIYFILAECAVEENNFAAAANYIRSVRSARRWDGVQATLPNYTTKALAYQDILRERRVELAFEGHRLIDLKRLGAIAGVSISRNAGDDVISTPLTLSITDYRWTLPIPVSELNGNPQLLGQQNPGY